MRLASIGLLILFMASMSLYASELSIHDIQNAIAAHNAKWTAEDNKFTTMTADERQKYVGTRIVDPADVALDQILTIPLVENLPDSFDWRDNNGNWMTPVKDQGSCGSCWAFSALGQVEAWWKIRNGNPDLKIDLSEQFLLSCSDAGNCEEGGWMSESLEFIKYNGIAHESDLPYQASSFVPCENTKSGWEQRAIVIPDWGYVTLDEAHVDNIKSAVYRYPLSVSYEVFDDFYSYKTGVYEHTFGASSGWHGVVIVGWNDREQSWIVKNSWGASWGDHGYFRIKWGDSSLGRYSPYIWNETPNARFTADVSEMRADLTYGDVDTLHFSLTNSGPDAAYFFANETLNDWDDSDWLTLENSAGYLTMHETATIDLIFNTRNLTPGRFTHQIEIVSNASNNPSLKIPVVLSVSKPQYDARLADIHFANDLSLLSWATPQCTIENIGFDSMRDFNIGCEIHQNERILLTDTVNVAHLDAGATVDLFFESFKLRQTGDLKFSVKIFNSPDYNDFNNELSVVEPVTHLVEGFEEPNDAWRANDGWMFTRTLNGHSGSASAHVNGGVFPYLDNMNTTLFYQNGFELDGLDTLFVSYWTRYVTADSNDLCIVEMSGDGENWETADSFTGVNPTWERRLVNLTEFAQKGFEKAWVRFQFVSDESGTSIGVLIDDMEVYTETIKTGVENPPTRIKEREQRPSHFVLNQNYPNPFNPTTTISYTLANAAQVRLTIYDVQGRLVEQLKQEYQPMGLHSHVWDAHALPAGIYFYSLEAKCDNGETFIDRKKMALIK